LLAADYSRYDRGFDSGRYVGHADVPPCPVIERRPSSRPDPSLLWSKFVALAIVGVMVVTGFAVLGHTVVKSAPEQQASVQAGTREATYTMDHMFELYLKSHDPADLGRWNNTMGLNDWWTLRETNYQEYQARTTYPYVLVLNPYSTQTTPDYDQGGMITTWYRLTIDAKNLTTIADGPNLDPIFTPVLGPTATAGAYMNISWYGTYLENWEVAAIRAGTHYANSYYGVPAGATPRATTDDGYYHELQGILTFNRAAAGKILGLTAAGDLRTQFNTSRAAITTAWYNNWITEGGPGASGIYDTYTAYDFSLAIQYMQLSLDPTSTQDNIVMRFWSISWGNECLLVRYMEAANVMKYWQGWNDDWYLNISIAPDGGSVHSRSVVGYQMYATKDSNNTVNGWALEASHMDWCGNTGQHIGYPSPYTSYDPKWTDVTHVSWAPLTTRYGLPVSYVLAPLHWNLTAGEKIIVKLPSASNSVLGYTPKRSTSDILGATKVAEMAANMDWGEMVMGNGYPNAGTNNLKSYYDPSTKMVTLTGPMNFTKNWNPSFPGLLETGAPMFVMNVPKVSDYSLEIVGDTPPYDDLVTATPYTLRVTARNGTGSIVPSYNGTFDFTSTDATATFGVVRHHWIPADNGVYQTTIRFGALGTFYVNATDANYTMDGKASITVNVITLIPEFPTLLVPVFGSVALLFILRSRRGRSK
jgi:hypothetical protein